jgi:hypothetical protein
MCSTPYGCQILVKLEFSRHIFEKKNTKISNFMNVYPVGADLLHTDGRTDRGTNGHDEDNSR